MIKIITLKPEITSITTRISSKYFHQNVLKCNSSTKSEIYDSKLIHGEASNSVPTSLQKSDSNKGVL